MDLLAVLVGNSVPLRGARVRAQHNTAPEDNADDGGTRFPGTRRVSRLDEVLVAPRVAEVEPRCVKHSEKRVEFGAAGGEFALIRRPPRRSGKEDEFCDFFRIPIRASV